MDEETLRHILHLQVRQIRNEELRSIVERVLEKVPDAYWVRESSKKYHPVDERGLNGSLRHTLKVTRLVSKLVDTIEHNQDQKDLLIASAILHDCLRHGIDGKAQWTVKNHPLLVRELIKECNIKSDWAESLCILIEGHMGLFGTPPVTPLANLGTILHFADYIAAQVDIEVRL